jgi:hypothetical protein
MDVKAKVTIRKAHAFRFFRILDLAPGKLPEPEFAP